MLIQHRSSFDSDAALRNLGSLPRAALVLVEGSPGANDKYRLEYLKGQVETLQAADGKMKVESSLRRSSRPQSNNSDVSFWVVLRGKRPGVYTDRYVSNTIQTGL